MRVKIVVEGEGLLIVSLKKERKLCNDAQILTPPIKYFLRRCE